MMSLFDDILGPINPISRVIGGIDAWLTMPHVKTFRERGAGGYIMRTIGVIAGIGMHWIDVPIKDDGKDFDETMRLVQRYGIPTSHYYHDSKHLYFAVPKEQARWAESALRAAASGKPYRAWQDSKR